MQKEDKISVVLPCLNEEETVAQAIKKAKIGIKRLNLPGEVIVVDNGSQDNSVSVAKKAEAKVIQEKKRGYGATLMSGFRNASGSILVMGDADDTYNFREIPLLYRQIQNGYDFISGNRLRGKIDPEAMPLIHRYLGVPILTFVLNCFFPTGIGDGHCGMRLFKKTLYEKMKLRYPGMEFASEMLIRAKQVGAKMVEVPISYGKRHTKSYSKMRSFHDGFRHLKLILRFAFGLEKY